MSLRLAGYVDLPEHARPGGFDHAAVHSGTRRVFVAHTANDALDVIDAGTDRYVGSIPGLPGVAGALVCEEQDLVFTSNRAENTVGIFAATDWSVIRKVPVSARPNGLAYDPKSQLLLAAGLGDPQTGAPPSVTLVDVARAAVVATVAMPGRTKWTVFDAATRSFYVNIADPARIVVIRSNQPDREERRIEVPAEGPHGLDLDAGSGRLFCACDAGEMIVLNPRDGTVLGRTAISGAPDATFAHPRLRRVYVAVANPGVIDALDADACERIETLATEKGAKTTALDAARNKLYVFLPASHRVAILIDE